MDKEPKDYAPFTKGFVTKCIHSWHDVDTDTGAVIPPIHVSSTYEVYDGVAPVFSILKIRNTYMEDSKIQHVLCFKRL